MGASPWVIRCLCERLGVFSSCTKSSSGHEDELPHYAVKRLIMDRKSTSFFDVTSSSNEVPDVMDPDLPPTERTTSETTSVSTATVCNTSDKAVNVA